MSNEMSFNIEWDVEQYREEHESEEHWELRKKFMITHKEKFPEDRVVCLAKVFYNVEFLGCKYPDKTMQLVAELSEGVADEHREKQKGKLKRTFVKASDAAGAKVKGRSNPACSTNSTQSTHQNKRFKPDTQNYKTRFISFLPSQENHQSPDKESEDIDEEIQIKEWYLKEKIKRGIGPFANMVIFTAKDGNPLSTIIRTCSMNKVKYSVENWHTEDGKGVCKILVDNQVLSSAIGSTKKEATASAAALGLGTLSSSCYTVEAKCDFVSGGEVITKDSGGQKSTTLDPPTDNIGAKIMRLMGWSGNEGLGKNNQGIEKPIEAQRQISRAGLGHCRGNALVKKFSEIFKDFAQHESEHDLVFSAEFTSDERAVLHKLARRFQLKTKSFGKGENRHLVVSKSEGDVWKIVEELLKNKDCESEKYRLIEPSSFSNRCHDETVMGVAESSNADEHRETEKENVTCVETLDAADVEKKEVEKPPHSTEVAQPSLPNDDLKPDTINDGVSLDTDSAKDKSVKPQVKKGTGPFADIVILKPKMGNEARILEQTCSANGLNYTVKSMRMSDGQFMCEVYINDKLLSIGQQHTKHKKKCKNLAIRLGLKTLAKSCYTVEEKFHNDLGGSVYSKAAEPSENTIDSSDNEVDDTPAVEAAADEPPPVDLPHNSIGVKMMKLMGWTGNHGLGKDSQGIRTPITALHNSTRTGLGITVPNSRSNRRQSKIQNSELCEKGCQNTLRQKYFPIFKQFAENGSDEDLVLTKCFKRKEKSVLTQLAREFRLITKTKCLTGLVVSKPPYSLWEIVEELLGTENMETEKFRLIEPSSLKKSDPKKNKDTIAKVSEVVAEEHIKKENENMEEEVKNEEREGKEAETKAADADMKDNKKIEEDNNVHCCKEMEDVTQTKELTQDVELKTEPVKIASQLTITFNPMNSCGDLKAVLGKTCQLNNIIIADDSAETKYRQLDVQESENLLGKISDELTGEHEKKEESKSGFAQAKLLKQDCEQNRGQFDDIIIFHTKSANGNPREILAKTSKLNKKSMSMEVKGEKTLNGHQCLIYINGKGVASGVGSKNSSKMKAYNRALDVLRASCYTIQEKFFYSSKGPIFTKKSKLPSVPIKKEEQGQMKNKQKQKKIVKTQAELDALNDLREKFISVFTKYAKSKCEYDLVFSEDFTGEERDLLFRTATQCRLYPQVVKLTSSNSSKKKILTVSNPQRPIMEIFEELLQKNGSTDKYRLIPPSCSSNKCN